MKMYCPVLRSHAYGQNDSLLLQYIFYRIFSQLRRVVLL